MELLRNSDIKLINEKINDIIEEIEETKLEILDPTKKELIEINNIILNFIKEHKRKIYGGYAQNQVVILKNPKDAFYKENKLPDIDFYSPDPLYDLKELSNRIYDAGHHNVEAKEA